MLTYSLNEGSTSRIHQHTAPKRGPPLEFIKIQPPNRVPPLKFINQRKSASRFHQPNRVLPLGFINQNQKGIPSTKRRSAFRNNWGICRTIQTIVNYSFCTQTYVLVPYLQSIMYTVLGIFNFERGSTGEQHWIPASS